MPTIYLEKSEKKKLTFFQGIAEPYEQQQPEQPENAAGFYCMRMRWGDTRKASLLLHAAEPDDLLAKLRLFVPPAHDKAFDPEQARKLI